MPGRITVLKDENMTLGTGNVLAIFSTPTDGTAGSHTKIKRLEISQSGTTTLQMIRAEFFTRDNAGTLTMTATTPRNLKPIGGSASAFTGNTAPVGGTARSGTDSSADSGGSYTQEYPFNFPNTAGYLYKPAPDEEIEVPASKFFGVRLLATPTTITGWTVTLELEEGG